MTRLIDKDMFHRKGCVGIVSRSAEVESDVMEQLTHLGLEQSGRVGFGDGPVTCAQLAEAMKTFNDDPETEVVLLIGAVEGDAEECCARWIRDNMKKPVVGFIAGGKAAERKLAALGDCGIVVTPDQPDVALVVRSVLYDDSFWMIG